MEGLLILFLPLIAFIEIGLFGSRLPLLFFQSMAFSSSLSILSTADLLVGLQLIIYAVAIVVFYVFVITTIPWEKVMKFEGFYKKEFLFGFPVLLLSSLCLCGMWLLMLQIGLLARLLLLPLLGSVVRSQTWGIVSLPCKPLLLPWWLRVVGLILVPMFFVIGIWGYKLRMYTAYKFFIYIFVSSLLWCRLYVSILWLFGPKVYPHPCR